MMFADARLDPQPLAAGFVADLQAWRTAIEDLLRHWSRDRLDKDAERALREKLQQERLSLESRIGQTFADVSEPYGEDQYAYAYRLLGGYRGIYEALLAHATLTADFNWEYWRESRF